jgi:hypothetical protein
MQGMISAGPAAVAAAAAASHVKWVLRDHETLGRRAWWILTLQEVSTGTVTLM